MWRPRVDLYRNPRASRHYLAIALLTAAVLFPDVASAQDGRWTPREFGWLAGAGFSTHKNIQLVPLIGRLAWPFPGGFEDSLAEHDLRLSWVVEPWIGGVFDGGNAFEVGVTPLAAKLDYDPGGRLVPYFTGGGGAMYTGAQSLGLSAFEFEAHGALGLQAFVSDSLALTLEARFRHISNAGIQKPNVGLDATFLLIGFEYLPARGRSSPGG